MLDNQVRFTLPLVVIASITGAGGQEVKGAAATSVVLPLAPVRTTSQVPQAELNKLARDMATRKSSIYHWSTYRITPNGRASRAEKGSRLGWFRIVSRQNLTPVGRSDWGVFQDAAGHVAAIRDLPSKKGKIQATIARLDRREMMIALDFAGRGAVDFLLSQISPGEFSTIVGIGGRKFNSCFEQSLASDPIQAIQRCLQQEGGAGTGPFTGPAQLIENDPQSFSCDPIRPATPGIFGRGSRPSGQWDQGSADRFLQLVLIAADLRDNVKLLDGAGRPDLGAIEARAAASADRAARAYELWHSTTDPVIAGKAKEEYERSIAEARRDHQQVLDAQNPPGSGPPKLGGGTSTPGVGQGASAEDPRCAQARRQILATIDPNHCGPRDLVTCLAKTTDPVSLVTGGQCSLEPGPAGGEQVRCLGQEQGPTVPRGNVPPGELVEPCPLNRTLRPHPVIGPYTVQALGPIFAVQCRMDQCPAGF